MDTECFGVVHLGTVSVVLRQVVTASADDTARIFATSSGECLQPGEPSGAQLETQNTLENGRGTSFYIPAFIGTSPVF